MTDEEYQRAQELVSEINAVRRQNAALAAELEQAERNVDILISNVNVLNGNVYNKMSQLSSHVGSTAEDVDFFYQALTELTEQYFTFKHLSTASRNMTMYTEMYYRRFSYYEKLRRITLGYVIGLDNTIISSENLRLEVERAYLQNSEYWLAYAIMAVMLWAQNERDAADRALKKALNLDFYKCSVFFLLVNLRFDRLQPAKEWYLNYLDKLDMTQMGSEFQYLLQAYLQGLFGTDPEFEDLVSENFKRLLAQADATSVNFADKFVTGAMKYAQTYLHKTEENFPTLYEVCPDYKNLISLLSDAEKHEIIAGEYVRLAEEPEEIAENQAKRIEDVLYSLISAYDDAEWKVVKEQKRNEAVIDAHGDMAAAEERFNFAYAHLDEKKNLADMMVSWAFSDNPRETNLTVKRFAISQMKAKLARGFERFAESYRKNEPSTVMINIDGCSLVCREDELELQSRKMEEYYHKNRAKHLLEDKFVKIYGVVCLAALLILVIMVFSFSAAALTIAVIAGVVGGFLLWRRIVDVGAMLDERKRLSLVKLQQALTELGQWRELFHGADAHITDVANALERY